MKSTLYRKMPPGESKRGGRLQQKTHARQDHGSRRYVETSGSGVDGRGGAGQTGGKQGDCTEPAKTLDKLPPLLRLVCHKLKHTTKRLVVFSKPLDQLLLLDHLELNPL